jgi:hypothetical protein
LFIVLSSKLQQCVGLVIKVLQYSNRCKKNETFYFVSRYVL